MSASPIDTLVSAKTILFLTTEEYSAAPSVSEPFSQAANISSLPLQNKALAETLFQAGVDVRFSSWKFPAAASTRATLCRFDVILFLCCGGYREGDNRPKFLRFLDETLIPLQEALPRLRVVNDARVVRWNVDQEGCLGELKAAGFKTQKWLGECVLCFVGGEFSHAGIQVPKAAGEGEIVNGANHVSSKELKREGVPKSAVEVGERLYVWLEKRFGQGKVGYMRLVGTAAEDEDGFVISAVDLIEPEMWLTRADEKERIERVVKCLLEERS